MRLKCYLFVQLIITSVYGQDMPEFIYSDQPAYIKIFKEKKIINDYISLKYYPLLDRKEYIIDSIKLNDIMGSLFEINIHVPQFIPLSLNKAGIQFFLVPGDTLELTYNGPDDITAAGTFGDINNYLINKYYHFDRFPYKAMLVNDIQLEPDEFIFKMDSIDNEELKYLERNKGRLPGWFINVYKSRIEYTTGLLKLQRPSMLKNFYGIELPTDSSYYDFTKSILLSNPYGKYFDNYYHYVYRYLSPKYSMSDLGYYINVVDSLFSDPNSIFLHQFYYLWIMKNSVNVSKVLDDLDPTDNFKPILKYLESQINSIEGKQALNFYLVNQDDEVVNMKQFKGKLVLLDFWFPGCKPCIKEFPYENELLSKYQNVLEIVNICLETKKEAWLNALEKFNISGVNLFPEGTWERKLKEFYLITAFPRYVLIGKDGTVLDDNTFRPSSNELKELIEKHLLD